MLPAPRSRMLATGAVALSVLTACGITSSMKHYVAPGLTAPARVAIIPPTFTVQIDGVGDFSEADRARLREAVEGRAMELVAEALQSRGYEASAADTANALDAIAQLTDGFVYHANLFAAAQQAGGTFDSSLVRRVAGGADAVLYLNASAVTVTEGKRAAQTAVAILIAAVIAAVVVLIVLAARNAGSGVPSSGGASVHGAVPVTAAGSAARVAAAPSAVVFRPMVSFHADLLPIYWVPQQRMAEPERVAVQPKARDRGFFDGNELRFFATLVDAATGTILWHVDQTLDADVESPSDVREAIEKSFATFPEQLSSRPR